MMFRSWTAAVLCLGLAACGGGGERSEASPPPVLAPKAEFQEVAGRQSLAFDQDAAPQAPGPTDPVDVDVQYIAYSHSLGLELPARQVDAVMTTHIEACRAAEPDVCLIANSNVNKQSDDYVTGSLFIRATPDWIETFLAGVDDEADAAGGEVTSRNTTAEDLTRLIIDTDARLRAQTTLRDRLETLLETRDGELKDLLDIERELARVTGQIESITSNLKALRLRVSKSSLSISYSTKIAPFSPSRQNPLARAIGDFFYNFSEALAAVITAFAVSLPWLFLIGVLLWIWLRVIWPRLRRRRSDRSTASE